MYDDILHIEQCCGGSCFDGRGNHSGGSCEKKRGKDRKEGVVEKTYACR